MKMVKINPPGTLCLNGAFFDVLKQTGARTFMDVGCGGGQLSEELLKRGLTGIGVDDSELAIAECARGLKEYIAQGGYRLLQSDFAHIDSRDCVDVSYSMMVLEHVQDDASFVRRLTQVVRPHGHVIVAVPARMSKWGFEDETVGHLRRYERAELKQLLEAAGLKNVRVISVGVPIINCLWNLSNFLLKRVGREAKKQSLSAKAQTASSGIREIPFKTVFPVCFRWILNPVVLSPVLLLQKLFFKTDLGLVMLAVGQK